MSVVESHVAKLAAAAPSIELALGPTLNRPAKLIVLFENGYFSARLHSRATKRNAARRLMFVTHERARLHIYGRGAPGYFWIGSSCFEVGTGELRLLEAAFVPHGLGVDRTQ